MSSNFHRKALATSLVAAMSGQFMPAMAQSPAGAVALEEIVVTARRREETLQDVPIMVNALTGADLEDLQIRDIQDLEGIVPGVDFSQTTFASQVSMRGIEMDTAKSGVNGTVETYLNDAPLQLTPLLKVMYDIGQIEVLRGPQGTLRGRASPSGSITITTRLPDLTEMGGYVDTTLSDTGRENINGAISVPIIADKLAFRLAGVFDRNEQNRVESLNSDVDPEGETKSWRGTLLFQPTDNLSIALRHESFREETQFFDTGVESMSIANPGWVNRDDGPFLDTGDRTALADTPNISDMDFTTTNLQVEWLLGDYQLNYVGQLHNRNFWSRGASDPTNLFETRFGPGLPEECPFLPGSQPPASQQGIGCFGGPARWLQSDADQESHEIRLSSAEPLFDKLDYTVGAFYAETSSLSRPDNRTHLVLDLPTITPTSTSFILVTPIERFGSTEESSVFGHLAWQFDDSTELAVGARHIQYKANSTLSIDGQINPLATEDADESATVWSATLTHDVNDRLMAFASVGTSWRYTMLQVGDFSLVKSPRQIAFQMPQPEESINYELGFKSNWMDNRLRLNGSVFYQDFDNYPYSSGSNIWYVNTESIGGQLTESVGATSQFVGAVPVDLWGVELEAALQVTERWSLGGSFAWAESEVQDGAVPCNDYFPNDGIPDTSTQMPTVEQIRAATGGENIASCTTTVDAFEQPSWNASLRTEYWHPVGDMEAFVRGQVSIYGDSNNVFLNQVDDQDGFNVVNLYTGLRSADGTWEVTLYGKNIFDEDAITSRGERQLTQDYRSLVFGQVTLDSDYRSVSLIPEREIGVSLRYRLGGG